MAHPDGRKRGSGETAKTFDWTRQAIELVNRLRKTLDETNKLWEHFNSANGDIGYFADINSSDDPENRINLSLRELNDTFHTLETLQRTLDDLSASCKDTSNAVS